MYQKVVTSLPPIGTHAFENSQLGLMQSEFINRYRKKVHSAVITKEAASFGQQFWYYKYVIDKWLGVLVTLTSLVCCIVFLVNGLYEKCDSPTQCSSRIFTVSTFLASYDSDSVTGWPVATERIYDASDLSKNVFTGSAINSKLNWPQYGECMFSAGFMGSKCNSTNILTYKTCLDADTAAAALINGCQSLTSTSPIYQWPTPDRYTDCLLSGSNTLEITRGSKNAFTYCLHNAFWPFYQVPQGIDTRYFLGSYNWVLFLFVALWIMTSFGVYTAYPIDYEVMDEKLPNVVEHGIPQMSYQRLGFLWAFVPVLWNIMLFSFTWAITFRDDMSYWKKDNIMYPTTITTGIVTIIASSMGLFYFLNVLSELYFPGYTFVPSFVKEILLQEFTQGKNAQHAETSRQKTAANKARRAQRASGGAAVDLPDGGVEMVRADDAEAGDAGSMYQMRGKKLLGASMLPGYPAKYNVNHDNVANVYIPPLTTVWADSYVVDPLFLLGIIGGIGQLTTDDAWNIFFLILFYRVCNMILARLIYQAFVKDYSNTLFTEGFKATHSGGYANPERRNALFGIKVHALAVQIAAWFFLIDALVLLLDKDKTFNRYGLLTWVLWLGYIIPELLRTLLHLALQASEFMTRNGVTSESIVNSEVQDPWGMVILTMGQFIWVWDLAVRLCFTMVIYFNSDVNYMGTKAWLQDHYQGLVNAFNPLTGIAV